jgi:hypothetical protein
MQFKKEVKEKVVDGGGILRYVLGFSISLGVDGGSE